MINVDFKKAVWEHCRSILEQRIAHAQKAMEAAQEAANSNDKSSAGDKYETSRAMGQLDRDMNAKQLAEAQAELNALLRLNMGVTGETVIGGSVVETDQGIYFIGAGIGITRIDDQQVVVLSLHAPLAKLLLGQKAGAAVNFNNKALRIVRIC